MATTSDIAKRIADHYAANEQSVERISVQRATDLIFPVRVWYTGDPDPEAFLLTFEDQD
jgi:hypothetical protein